MKTKKIKQKYKTDIKRPFKVEVISCHGERPYPPPEPDMRLVV